jgi:hypothetical protein
MREETDAILNNKLILKEKAAQNRYIVVYSFGLII